MFTLAVIHDTIKVLASQLNTDTVAALTHNINAKYANRVLPNVGLCVCLFDHVDVSEGHIRHGDGGTYYKTTFRLVVFRPFIGEVLVGRVRSSDERGMRLTMGFFDDIHVGWDGMPQPSAYDQAEAAWFWVWGQDVFQDGDGEGGGGEEDGMVDPFQTRKDERFYLDKDELVRFVVEGEAFSEPEPPGPSKWKPQTGANSSGADGGDAVEAAESAKRVAPYKIKASMTMQGTGALSWWNEAQVLAK